MNTFEPFGAGPVAVIAAHPDDEVLGCGATLAQLVDVGVQVSVLFLSTGEGARAETDDPARQQAAKAALSCLGVAGAETARFPDNQFDTVALLDIVKRVEAFLDANRPQTVLTHFAGDLNVDHRLTAQAVVTACRPGVRFAPASLLSFEVPSSSEWNLDPGSPRFRPSVYVDATSGMARKLAALAAYEAEMRPFPHPRSEEGVTALAKVRGTEAGVTMAEGFELLRSIHTIREGSGPTR